MADPRKPAETPDPDRRKPDLPPPAPPVQEPPHDPQGGDRPGDTPVELPPRDPTLRQGAGRIVGPEDEDRRLRPDERHPPGVNP